MVGLLSCIDPLKVILLRSCCVMTSEMLLFMSKSEREFATLHEIIRFEQSTHTESSTRTLSREVVKENHYIAVACSNYNQSREWSVNHQFSKRLTKLQLIA